MDSTPSRRFCQNSASVAGAGKTPRHADDRDGQRLHGAAFQPLPGHPAALRAVRERLAAVRLRAGKMRGERAHRGELKQIDESDLAPQRLLQPGVHLGNGEGVRAEIEEVVVQAHARNAQRLLPDARDDAFHLVGGLASRLEPQRRQRGSAAAA